MHASYRAYLTCQCCAYTNNGTLGVGVVVYAELVFLGCYHVEPLARLLVENDIVYIRYERSCSSAGRPIFSSRRVRTAGNRRAKQAQAINIKSSLGGMSVQRRKNVGSRPDLITA